jgi:tetratricopeptide (TPR) repeat protein
MRFLRAAGLLGLICCLGQAPHLVWAQTDPEEVVTDDEEDEPEAEPEPEPEPPPAKVPDRKPPPKPTPAKAPPADETVTEEPDEEAAPPSEAPPSEDEEDQAELAPDAGARPVREPPPRPSEPRLPEPPPPPEPVSVISEKDLLERIEARGAAVRSGDTAMADVELSLIEETRKQIGAPNVVLASAQLIHEAQQAIAAGLTPRAEVLADAAVRLSPDLVAGHWMRTRAYAESGLGRLGPLLGAVVQLVMAQLSNFRNLLSLLSSVALLLGCGLLGLAVLFVALQLFKYLRYPAHDIAEVFPGFISAGEIAIALLLALALPAVLGLGVMPVLILGLVLVAGYQLPRERALGLGLIVFLGASPGLLYLASPLITFHGSITDALATAAGEALAGDAEQRVAELAGPNRDYATSVILAYRQRQRGDLLAAEAQYQAALRRNPGSVLAQNNLGVVLFLLGREDAAEKAFQQAAGPRAQAEPALNLSSIYFERGDFDLGKKTLEQARQVDPSLTERYTQRESTLPLKSKLLEARVGQAFLWERLVDSGWPEGEAVMAELWQPIGRRTPPLAMPLIAVLGLVAAILVARRSDRLSTPCPKCGIPASRRAPAQFCTQCHSVFLTSVAVEPALRRHKEDQVRGYQVRRRWYLRLFSLVAGAGHLFGGRPFWGALLLVPFLACTTRIALGDRLSVHSWRIFVDGSGNTVVAVIAGGISLLLVLIALRTVAEK